MLASYFISTSMTMDFVNNVFRKSSPLLAKVATTEDYKNSQKTALNVSSLLKKNSEKRKRSKKITQCKVFNKKQIEPLILKWKGVMLIV